MTLEEAKQKFDKQIAWIDVQGFGTAKTKNEKLNAERQYWADVFLVNGKLHIFWELQEDVMRRWHKLVDRWLSGGDTGLYLRTRDDTMEYYQRELVQVGLADRKWTLEEREWYDVRSWQFEKNNPILMEDGVQQEEACVFAFRVFKHWTHDFHKDHVPSLADNIIKPQWYVNLSQEKVYEEPGIVDVLTPIKITQVELDEFRATKAS